MYCVRLAAARSIECFRARLHTSSAALLGGRGIPKYISNMHLRSLTCAFALALVATLTLAPTSTAQSTRDSAGIRVVENAQPTWSSRERLSLAAAPRIAIGSNADSAFRFRQVRGVMRLSDGRIAVADGASLQLRLFSAEGKHISSSGGKGGEPSQLQGMNWVRRLPGDTIVIGPTLSSAAIYSSTGQYLRTANFRPRTEARPTTPGPLVFAMLSSNLVVASPFPNQSPRSVGAKWTDSLSLSIVSESGAAPRALGAFPHIELEQVASGLTSVWLSAIGVFAASDDHFYAGFGDRYEVKVFSHAGTLQTIIRRAWKPTPITDADWEHWVVEWSKLWVRSTGAEREREIQKVREAPWAEQNPAFSQFIVDRIGRLWVRDAHWQDAIAAGSLTDTPAVPTSWSVFDIRGRWLGDVSTPTGLKVFEIGADYIIGTMRKADVNQVVIFDLSARRQQ